jgi:hypothetical protein
MRTTSWPTSRKPSTERSTTDPGDSAPNTPPKRLVKRREFNAPVSTERGLLQHRNQRQRLPRGVSDLRGSAIGGVSDLRGSVTGDRRRLSMSERMLSISRLVSRLVSREISSDLRPHGVLEGAPRLTSKILAWDVRRNAGLPGPNCGLDIHVHDPGTLWRMSELCSAM